MLEQGAEAPVPWPVQWRRLVAALAFAVLSAGVFAAGVGAWRLWAGDGLKQAVGATSFTEFRHLRLSTGLDSWGPMFAAWNRLHPYADTHHGGVLYADTLALDNCKFQYPPASLLVLELLPPPPAGQFVCSRDADLLRAVEGGAWSVKPAVDVAALLAVLATIAASAWILLTALRPAGGMPGMGWREGALLGGLFLGAGLVFHPLIWGYELGQVQVFINLVIALAVLAAMRGRPVLAGALLGLCCLFKPQYAVILAWAAWRRQWRLAAGLAAVAAAGNLAALALYGWDVHLEYLDFLRELARRSEAYWANQTVSGLVGRFLQTAEPLQWADSMFAPAGVAGSLGSDGWAFAWDAVGFPPYHPLVYRITLLSSLLIVGGALLAMRGQQRSAEGMTLEIGIAVAACTIASPIAWHHHYGSFLPLLALAAGLLVRSPRPDRATVLLLGASYVLLANCLLRPELLFGNRVLGLLASNTLFGALALLGVLVVLRRGPGLLGQAVAGERAARVWAVGAPALR